jgi:hypothetical protein
MPYRYFVFPAALMAAQIALAQSGMSGTCDVNLCKMAFTFGPAGIGIPNAIGAYSGVQTKEFLKQFPDGTSRTMLSFPPVQIYRDSQTRIRFEHPISSPHNVRAAFEVPWVEIQDPVAGYLYSWTQ